MNLQQEIARALIRGLAYNVTRGLPWPVALAILVILAIVGFLGGR